jgi:sec-independent protein translocase protein TatA
MFGLGIWELALIFGIVLLLFGARRLPDIASGLGGAINNFKKAMKEGEDTKPIDTEKQIGSGEGSSSST